MRKNRNNRPPEVGARGLLRLGCRCGATISLERGLAHYEFECGCCGLHAKGQTNIEDLEITIPCKCGNPITLHWNKDARRYEE